MPPRCSRGGHGAALPRPEVEEAQRAATAHFLGNSGVPEGGTVEPYLERGSRDSYNWGNARPAHFFEQETEVAAGGRGQNREKFPARGGDAS